MAFKTSGANIVRKSSTRASGVAAYAEATNEFVLLGRSVEVQDVSIKKTSVVTGSDLSKTNLGGPAITSLVITDSSYNALDDTAVLPAGGYAKVIGTGFQSGAVIYLNGSALTTTFISSTELRIVIPATSLGTYSLMLFNPDNTGAIYLNLVTSDAPSWITNAGNVAAYIETTNISANVRANTSNNDSITYSLVSGSLPSGATLYANGLIAGTAPAEANSTTYSFVINATDTQNQNVSRSFSMTINTDVVTWSSPADGTIYSISNSTAISNVTLAATNLAGGNIVYTANTLPGGISLTNNVLFGTPANAYATSTLLTANATTTGRTSTRTIHWSIQLPNDEFFKYVTTLLSASNSANTFVKDSSVNSSNVVISGDTKPFNFNPYTPGYYSNYFNGSTDYLSIADSANLEFGSGTITVECWFYMTGTSAYILDKNNSGTGAAAGFSLYVSTTTVTWYYDAANNGYVVGPITTSAVTQNAWHHIACVRSVSGSTTNSVFVDGVRIGTSTTATAFPDNGQNFRIGATFLNGAGYGYLTGYVSNVRFVKGTAVYDPTLTTLTVPTSPLTAITNTQLLTCQSNRFIDNSTNAFAVTLAGAPTIQGFIPYTPSSSYSTYGSAYFDGTGDYLSWSGTSIAGDFTAEAWVYPTANDASGYCVLYGSSAANNQLYYNASTGAVGLVLNATIVISATGTAVKLNAWNHIAFVRSGSTCTIYVNGASAATGTNSSTFNLGFLGTYAYTTPSGYEVNGYVTDARIVNGTAIYTGAFTPPTAPLTAVANTVLLTCQGNQPVANNTFLDNSTNNLSITRSGNTNQGTFSPYGAGFSNYFDGTGDYLSFNAVTSPTTGDFTVEFWFYNTRSAWNTTFDITDGGNGAMAIYFGSGGDLRIAPQAQSSTLIASVSSLSLNTWIHFAIIRSSGSLRAYANGTALAAAISYTTSLTGFTKLGGTTDGYVLGYISNFRYTTNAVYSIAGSTITVPTSPLQAIAGTQFLTCQSPSIVDNSANNLTITRNGDTSVQRFSPFAGTTLPTPYYGAYFDGNGDYLTVPDNSAWTIDTDYTIEFWLYSTAFPGQYNNIVSQRGGASSYWGINYDTSLGWSLFWNNGSGETKISRNQNSPLNTWVHVAVVKSGTTGYMFINGTQAGATFSFPSISDVSSSLYIGAWYTPGDYINGYLSNLRMVKGTAVYTSNFTPSTTPLTAITNTSLLTCQSNTFIDNSTNNFTITANGNSRPTTFNPFTVSYSTGQSYTPAVFGGSMYFDGTGDYLTDSTARAQYSFYGRDGTVECWVYPTSFAADRIIWSLKNTGAGVNDNMLKLAATSGVLQWSDGTTWNSSGVTPPLNAWSHIAWVKSSTTVKLYLNGVQVLSVSYSPGTNNRILVVGADDIFSAFMMGYIADFRIVNGTALYTSNFVPGNAPLTAVRNTVLLLNGTSDSISDASGMVNFETVGDTKVNNLGPYSGNYYSNYFDGTGDYLTAPTNTAFQLGTGDFTIECWINKPSAANGPIIDTRGSATAVPYAFYVDGSNFPYFYDGTVYTSTVAIVNNQWNHIAVVRVSSVLKIFVNGVQGYSASHSVSLNPSATVYIGGQNFSTSAYTTGYISNLRLIKGQAVYTAAFTPPTAPLTAISGTGLLTCQSNRFIDNSTNAFTITRNGDTRVATQNPFRNNSDYSMYFDGTGDYLTTPSTNFQNFAFGTGDFTMEAWIYPTVFSGDKVIISSFATWATSVNFFFGIRAGTPNILIFRAGDSIPITLNGNTGLNANEWAHVAVSRSSGTTRIFVNGVVQTATHSGSVNISNTVRPVVIGSDDAGAPAELFVGNISDLRVTKGVARYTATFTPPTTPFLGK